MIFEHYNFDKTEEVVSLFIDVFTQSENAEEGHLLGCLVTDMHEQEPTDDIYGFIAKKEGKVIGCIFFSRLTFDTPVEAFILSPVAISTDFQNQGIGRELIQFGINDLIDKHIDFVFTYGDPNIYSKVDFKAISEDFVQSPLHSQFPPWLAYTTIR